MWGTTELESNRQMTYTFKMRKDKSGPIPKNPKIKEEVRKLRKANYSYTEIGNILNISRQLAYHHDKK